MTLIEKAQSDWPSAVVFGLGVIVLLVPFFVGGTTTGTQFSGIFSGVFLMGYGGYDVIQKQVWGTRLARYWATAAVGLWVIASPFVVKSAATVRYVNIVAGIVAIIMAVIQLLRKTDRDISIPGLSPNS